MTELNRDLELKARWVADMMQADGVKPEQVTGKLSLAYMETIRKKIVTIQNKYLSNPAATGALNYRVVSMLPGQQDNEISGRLEL